MERAETRRAIATRSKPRKHFLIPGLGNLLLAAVFAALVAVPSETRAHADESVGEHLEDGLDAGAAGTEHILGRAGDGIKDAAGAIAWHFEDPIRFEAKWAESENDGNPTLETRAKGLVLGLKDVVVEDSKTVAHAPEKAAKGLWAKLKKLFAKLHRSKHPDDPVPAEAVSTAQDKSPSPPSSATADTQPVSPDQPTAPQPQSATAPSAMNPI